MFIKLCGYSCIIHPTEHRVDGTEHRVTDYHVLIFDINDSIYRDSLLDFRRILHLESIGLLHTFERNFCFPYWGRRGHIQYFNNYLALRFDDNQIEVGNVMLSEYGEELIPIAITYANPVAGFYEYVQEKWRDYIIN